MCLAYCHNKRVSIGDYDCISSEVREKFVSILKCLNI